MKPGQGPGIGTRIINKIKGYGPTKLPSPKEMEKMDYNRKFFTPSDTKVAAKVNPAPVNIFKSIANFGSEIANPRLASARIDAPQPGLGSKIGNAIRSVIPIAPPRLPIFTPKATPTPLPPTPTPSPTPTPAPRVLNFAPHIGPQTKRTIYAPSKEDQDLMFKYFPQEATSSAVAAFNESMYNPLATNKNTQPGRYKGTVDKGYFQINAGKADDPTIETTFDELMRKYAPMLREHGITSENDLFDKEKNFFVAKLIREKLEKRSGQKPWGRWHGWKNQGFQRVGDPTVNYQE